MIIDTVADGRNLYRTQYVAITKAELDNIIKGLDAKLNETGTLLYTTYNLATGPILNNELNPPRVPFLTMTLAEYIASERNNEVGGTRRKKYKSKQKTKKYKQTKRKPKSTKTKNRKTHNRHR